MDTLGMALIDGGDLARGTQLLRMASNLAPRSNEIRLHLGAALVKSGDVAGARASLEPLTRLESPSPLRAEAEKVLSSR
jgi:Flp pilus assembly protein TadD